MFWSYSISFFVDAATITQKSDLALVDIGKTAYLECTVDANPITKDLIKWQRKPNYVEDSLESFTTLPTFDSDSVTMSDNERFKITILDNRSFLSVFNVSESDSGAYECLASNGIGSPDSATTNLIVKRKLNLYHEAWNDYYYLMKFWILNELT